ncbi:MAG: hypothetical protein C4293_07415 [Nitrospiraceae bacterium]
MITDPKGVIQEVNHAAATLLNVSAEALAGKPLIVYVAKEEQPSFRGNIPWILAHGRIQGWKVRLQPHKGAAMTVSPTVMAVR